MNVSPPFYGQSGLFVVVIGASGTGKDTLLREMERAGAGVIVVERRIITRPAEPSEPHIPVTVADFEAMEHQGAFCLSWRAHGYCYGISSDLQARLAAGLTCVASVSRTVVGEARKKFPRTLVVEVMVPDAIREQRLIARGREALPDIQKRLGRSIDARTTERADILLDNSGPIKNALKTLFEALGSDEYSRQTVPACKTTMKG